MLTLRFLESAALAALLPFLPACNSEPDGATIALSVGGEADAWTRAPAPTRLIVDSLDAKTGAATNFANVALPAGGIDLGDRNPTALMRIRANAIDATGQVLVTGTTVPLQLGALAGTTLSLFVQRTSEFARMPSRLVGGDAREAPVVVNVANRYLCVTGGNAANAASTQLYDWATLSAVGNPPTMPRAPQSVAAWGTALLLVNAEGASWFELADSSFKTADPVAGGNFAEVAGGRAIQAPDGTAYIVGGTRQSSVTSRVLKIAADGSLVFVSLAKERRGAAAAWVEGRGLVIAGGSTEGVGVEILAAGATATTPLAYPADATMGAGAAALDGSHVLLAGGIDATGQPAPTRVLDLACASACAAVTWDAAKVSLPTAQGFDLNADGALFVGDDASGLSHAMRVSRQGAIEIPFKVPRRGARGARVNPPAITFVGGADIVESYTP